MRIESIKTILLKEEYLETIEGQNVLVDKVNEDEEEQLYFEEGSYGSTDIMLESLYCGLIENDLLRSMFFGDDRFQYKYTPWECELGQQNPSEEQIVEYIKKCYGEDDEENIECIKQSTSFHDAVDLKWITGSKAQEIVNNISMEKLLYNLEELERKLKKENISVDEWKNEENKKFLEQLLCYIREAAMSGCGILYVHTLF